METNRLVRVLDVSQYTEYGMPVLLAIFLLAFVLPLSVQADANDDFVVQRGVALITGTSTTLVAGVDYNAPSASTSAFIRITNTHHTGAGPDTGSGDANAIDATAYVVDPGNVETSVTIARPGSVNANTRVAWELVEYQGMLGGENEMIVREQRALTYDPASTTAAGPAVSNILADDDIVVFITGQFSPDEGSDDFNAVLSTASWDANSDRPLFERGEAGGDAVRVSYAIIEFTGSNWNVARVPDHVYTEAGVTETSAIAPVGSLTRAFIHTQKRVGPGLNTHADIGHEVWLSGIGQVSYRLDGDAGTPSAHVAAVWVIENAQTEGSVMQVTRSNGTHSGGASPTTTLVSIGAELSDLSVSSIFMNNSGSGTSTSFPEPMISSRVFSSTQYELWISDTVDSRTYRTEIVEWPTAEPEITQNNYYFFVNNNSLTPLDAWPPGAGDIGENAEITGLDEPLGDGDTIRIRMALEITAAAMPAGVETFKLQYAERNTSCTAVSVWSNVGMLASTTAIWRGTTTPIADGTTLNTLLISVSDVAGTFEEENPSAVTPNAVLAGENIEFDWVIENNAAPERTDFCFRMVKEDGTEFEGYDFYPVIRTIGYGVQSQDWKWFDDAESETPVNVLSATNTAPIDIAFENTIQLRLTLKEVNGGSATATKFRLQFSEYSDFSTSTDLAEIGDCTDLSLWCYAGGGGVDNATITERTLGDADVCAGGLGGGCGTHNESGITVSNVAHNAGEAREFAFTLQQAGARVNRVYFFRAYDTQTGEAVPLGEGESYPSLVTEGASLSFGIGGIASGAMIEGIPMDIDTTATEISFGSLPVGSNLAGAHRLGIDTNGTEGYQLLVFAQGDFLNQLGEQIEGVTGTNAAPTGWNTGCLLSAKSCFGYHTGDDVLQGGSTRFSPMDSYARLNTAVPEEIAFSTSPVAGATTDIVYRIRVSELQGSGQYETNIIYIALPVF